MEALGGVRHPPSMKLYDDPPAENTIWSVRKSGLGATAHVPGQPPTWEGWEDSSVPVERLGDYLRALRKLFDRYEYACALYGHFGQGCVHTRIDFDLETADGIKKFRSFLFDAADLVLSFGGSLSGEHGDGQSRGELLPKMFGPALMGAFEEFKSIWDPDWKMNPGKIVRPYRVDENLRLGTDYRPPSMPTHFNFPQDNFSFARASIRCVGVGECRREQGGTMCPSYRVTREEMHSTRGRAHLLFELLEGDPLTGGWRDEHVKESLDLCLACRITTRWRTGPVAGCPPSPSRQSDHRRRLQLPAADRAGNEPKGAAYCRSASFSAATRGAIGYVYNAQASFPEADYLAHNTLSQPPWRAMPWLIGGAVVTLGLFALKFLWRKNPVPRMRREDRHGFFAVS